MILICFAPRSKEINDHISEKKNRGKNLVKVRRKKARKKLSDQGSFYLSLSQYSDLS